MEFFYIKQTENGLKVFGNKKQSPKPINFYGLSLNNDLLKWRESCEQFDFATKHDEDAAFEAAMNKYVRDGNSMLDITPAFKEGVPVDFIKLKVVCGNIICDGECGECEFMKKVAYVKNTSSQQEEINWDKVFEEADKYAKRKDEEDKRDNNAEPAYWFWFKMYLKQKHKVTQL